jgi:hypothetical protein
MSINFVYKTSNDVISVDKVQMIGFIDVQSSC